MMGHMDALRTVVHMDGDQMWEARSAEGRGQRVVREVAERLRGLATCMTCLAVGASLAGDLNTDHVSFLAATVNDLALALERVHGTYWERVGEADRAREAGEAGERKQRKRKKGGRP